MTRTPRPLELRERMDGWVAKLTHVPSDYREAALFGKLNNWKFSQDLRIEADDGLALVHDHGHAGRITGQISWPRVSKEPLQVQRGHFILFQDDPGRVGLVHMRYEMLLDGPGGPYFFVGVKNLHSYPYDIFHVWSQATTLYVTIYGGVSEDENRVIARGITRVSFLGVLQLVLSLRAPNATKKGRRRPIALRFLAAFITELYRIYGGFGAFPRREGRKVSPGEGRTGGTTRADDDDLTSGLASRLGEVLLAEEHFFLTDDDVKLLLSRYKGGVKGPVILTHGLGVSSEIFSVPTIERSLLNFLYDDGYDVWLLDYRTSTTGLLPGSADQPWSGDDVARHDYPSAVDEVLRLTGASSVQMVAHCFGAMTFVMAMLYGKNDIHKKVRSAVCSQIATNVLVPWPTRLKAAAHAPDVFAGLKIRYVTSRARRDEAWYDALIDWVLGLAIYPAGPEHCSSADCHRISFLYGLLYQHGQLNTPTHERGLAEMFGDANVRAFQHLCKMIRHKEVVSLEDDFCYMEHLERLNIPIAFVHGARNRCYLPKSTKVTLQLLEKKNGPGLYERYVVPEYGHIDCIFGKNATNDVYPYISAALNQFAAPPGPS